jgi:hypothetical protein
MDAERQRRLAQLIQIRRGRQLLHRAVALGVPELTVYRMRRRLIEAARGRSARLYVAPLTKRT